MTVLMGVAIFLGLLAIWIVGFWDIIRDLIVGCWRSRRPSKAKPWADRAIADLAPAKSITTRSRPNEEPWSSQEREVFGINDTDQWIRDTERLLKGLEWARAIAETPGARPGLAPEDPPGPMIQATHVHATDPDIETVTILTGDGRIVDKFYHADPAPRPERPKRG